MVHLHENGILKTNLFLVLVPHLEAQSLLGFAISYCGNDCCSVRAGALLLGGKGAAGADEYLNHPSFMQRSLQNYTHRGKDEIEKPHRLTGMVLKMFPSLTSHRAGVKLGTSCAAEGAKFIGAYKEMPRAVLRLS